MTPEPFPHRERAIRAVLTRVADLRITRIDLAKRAGVDHRTLRNFLDGKTMPHTGTLSRLEFALDWPEGEIVRRMRAAPSDLSAFSNYELAIELCHRLTEQGQRPA